MRSRHVGRGGGPGGRGPPRKKLNFRKNKPPSPLDSFQSQFIAVLQSTNFFNAKCRLKHPISRNFSGGMRPPSPRQGAAPPDPCHSLLAPLAAQLLWTRRLASLAKGPPQRKNLATCLVRSYFFELDPPILAIYFIIVQIVLDRI